jgi:hypothetical protein
MGVVAGAGLLIGVAAVYQTPLYTNGFLLLGGVTVLSFTAYHGVVVYRAASTSLGHGL